MADHEEAVEPGEPGEPGEIAGRYRRTGSFFAAITVGVLLLVGGIGVLVSGVLSQEHRATAQPHPDAEAERPATALRLLPALPTLAESEHEDSPITVPASGRGTELFDSLPQRVGPFALIQISAMDTTGALEQYAGLYAVVDDNGEAVADQENVKLTVSRWGTESEANDRARQKRQSVAEASESDAEEVVRSGAEGGNFYAVANGTDLTILWSDFTTVGSVSGAPGDVRKLFDEFSLGSGAHPEQSR